jgi:hypothetical protein
LNTKFLELHCEIWLQSWNLLKIWRVKMNFVKYLWVSSYLVGHLLLFWKETMQAFQKTPNFQQIWPLKKKIIGGSLLTGGVAGIRAVVFFSSTYCEVPFAPHKPSKRETTVRFEKTGFHHLVQVWPRLIKH